MKTNKFLLLQFNQNKVCLSAIFFHIKARTFFVLFAEKQEPSREKVNIPFAVGKIGI